MSEAQILYDLALSHWRRYGGPMPRYPQRRLGPLQEAVDAEGNPYTYQDYESDGDDS